MSYPAYESFGKRIGRGYAIWRVYMALQPPRLDFAEPRAVKTLWLAHELQMGRRHVIASLNWLAAHGYVIEHDRESHGVRTFRLAYALKQAA